MACGGGDVEARLEDMLLSRSGFLEALEEERAEQEEFVRCVYALGAVCGQEQSFACFDAE